jgi:hypothetical protein
LDISLYELFQSIELNHEHDADNWFLYVSTAAPRGDSFVSNQKMWKQ